jgi:hypothetical protein
MPFWFCPKQWQFVVSDGVVYALQNNLYLLFPSLHRTVEGYLDQRSAFIVGVSTLSFAARLRAE